MVPCTDESAGDLTAQDNGIVHNFFVILWSQGAECSFEEVNTTVCITLICLGSAKGRPTSPVFVRHGSHGSRKSLRWNPKNVSIDIYLLILCFCCFSDTKLNFEPEWFPSLIFFLFCPLYHLTIFISVELCHVNNDNKVDFRPTIPYSPRFFIFILHPSDWFRVKLPGTQPS